MVLYISMVNLLHQSKNGVVYIWLLSFETQWNRVVIIDVVYETSCGHVGVCKFAIRIVASDTMPNVP